MKKLFFVLAVFAFLSCEKESTLNPTGIGNVCAECVELNSGFHADKFCGTPQEVSVYVKELEKIQDQNWSCTIK